MRARAPGRRESGLRLFGLPATVCAAGARDSGKAPEPAAIRRLGEEGEDLDVLVRVHDATRQDRRALQDLAFDLGLEQGLVLSPLLADAASWQNDSFLARAIAREGIAL